MVCVCTKSDCWDQVMIHNPFDAGDMFKLKVRKLKFSFKEKKQNHA
jgi:hypothetical protein